MCTEYYDGERATWRQTRSKKNFSSEVIFTYLCINLQSTHGSHWIYACFIACTSPQRKRSRVGICFCDPSLSFFNIYFLLILSVPFQTASCPPWSTQNSFCPPPTYPQNAPRLLTSLWPQQVAQCYCCSAAVAQTDAVCSAHHFTAFYNSRTDKNIRRTKGPSGPASWIL